MIRKTLLFTLMLLLIYGACNIHAAVSATGNETTGNRNLIICFEVKEYNGKIQDSINWIFNKLIRPGDNLIVYSPTRVYGFSQKTLSRPKDQLSAWLQGRFKADAALATTSFQQVFSELKDIVLELYENHGGQDAKALLNRYKQGLSSMSAQRRVNQQLLMSFAEMFRKTPGENHVLLFFEKELRPIPDGAMMDSMMQNPDLSFTASEVFMQPHEEDKSLNSQSVIDSYAQVKARFHFAYLKTKKQRPPRRMDLHEHSTHMYAYFSRLAEGTGGLKINTSNPLAVMKEFSGFLKKGRGN